MSDKPKKCPVCQTFVNPLKEGFDAYQQWQGTVQTYIHERMDGRIGCGLCGAVWRAELRVWWPLRISIVSRSTKGAVEIGGCEETSKRVWHRRFGYGVGWFRLRILFGRGW